MIVFQKDEDIIVEWFVLMVIDRSINFSNILQSELCTYKINFREYQRSNNKWAIQRNWEHWFDKTKKNTTQDVLDTTICQQTT
jgi:hypothetical protein